METPKYYKNPLDEGRQSDQALLDRLGELKRKLEEEGKLMEATMDEFAGQDKDAYNLTKIMLNLNYQLLRFGELLGHRDLMCRELVNAIYASLNHQRELHEKRNGLLDPMINDYHNKGVVEKWFSGWAGRITTIATLITAAGVIFAFTTGLF